MKVKFFYFQRELWNAPLHPFVAPYPILNITLLHWVAKQTSIQKKAPHVPVPLISDKTEFFLHFNNGDIYSICIVCTGEMFEPLAIYCSHA